MNDRELLELAAKAVGYTLAWGEEYIVGDDEVDCTDLPYINGADREEADSYWNPLEDDGDALRLMVKLGIDVITCLKPARSAACPPDIDSAYLEEEHGADPCAATRRAIVRAAASIAEAA